MCGHRCQIQILQGSIPYSYCKIKTKINDNIERNNTVFIKNNDFIKI